MEIISSKYYQLSYNIETKILRLFSKQKLLFNNISFSKLMKKIITKIKEFIQMFVFKLESY